MLTVVSCKEASVNIITGQSYSHGEYLNTFKYRVNISFDEHRIITNLSHIENPQGETTWKIITYGSKDSIQFLELNCLLVDRVKIDNKSIYKYRYDQKDEIDEEVDIYLNENQKLIAIKSLAWSQFELFDFDADSHKILLADSSQFFKYNFRYDYL